MTRKNGRPVPCGRERTSKPSRLNQRSEAAPRIATRQMIAAT